MPKLPKLSGHKVIKALAKAGFQRVRQKGSHVILIKDDGVRIGCTVPLHNELEIGTLKGILEQAKLSEEDFLQLL